MRHIGWGFMLIGVLIWLAAIVSEDGAVVTAIIGSAFFVAGGALAAGEMVRNEIRKGPKQS